MTSELVLQVLAELRRAVGVGGGLSLRGVFGLCGLVHVVLGRLLRVEASRGVELGPRDFHWRREQQGLHCGRPVTGGLKTTEGAVLEPTWWVARHRRAENNRGRCVRADMVSGPSQEG